MESLRALNVNNLPAFAGGACSPPAPSFNAEQLPDTAEFSTKTPEEKPRSGFGRVLLWGVTLVGVASAIYLGFKNHSLGKTVEELETKASEQIKALESREAAIAKREAEVKTMASSSTSSTVASSPVDDRTWFQRFFGLKSTAQKTRERISKLEKQYGILIARTPYHNERIEQLEGLVTYLEQNASNEIEKINKYHEELTKLKAS